MISAPGSRNTASTRSPSARCAASSAGVNCGVAAVVRPEVGAIEADEMIDAIAVEQIGVAARAVAQPVEVALGQHVPAVDRQAPVLPGLAERIGRHADRRVEAELVLPRPDVGAVAADHERQVAEERDVAGVASRALPH